MGVLVFLVIMGACSFTSDAVHPFPLPGQRGCTIVEERIVDADTPSGGPAASEVVATLSEAVRTTTFVPGDGLETHEAWEDTLRFELGLVAGTTSGMPWAADRGLADGEVVAVSYAPEEGELGTLCTPGDFLVAPVEGQVEASHIGGSGQGAIWWHGDDLSSQLRAVFRVPWNLEVDATIELLAQESLDRRGCQAPPADYALTSIDEDGHGLPWGGLSFSLDAVTSELCSAPLAVSDGLWEELPP